MTNRRGDLPFSVLLDLGNEKTPISMVIGAHESKLTAEQALEAAEQLKKLANFVTGGDRR